MRFAPRMWTDGRAHEESDAHDVVVGLVAGVVAGVIGAWAMNQVGPALDQLRHAGQRRANGGHGEESKKKKSGQQRANSDEDQSATVRVARIVSRAALGHDVPEDSQHLAGNAVHFTVGALNGAMYGAMAEIWPHVVAGRGTLFGALLWASADEAALPALGLAAPPTRYPISSHAESLTTHLVYGLTTDTVRRLIRRALS
jgi:uncharacterized protein DUF1440